mmetsp:Transcript_10718/g.15126  ORF Transcript_10718/g.15126 Transcript_10718/m.15126 type:complete len:273 (+) Transcript_10718:100-918(+)
MTTFEINVTNDSFKFNAAHFVAFSGFRERLHGHNYRLSVRLLGSRKIGHDGYVVDFGDVKRVVKQVCKDLNEHFICPMLSDVISIEFEKNDMNGKNLNLKCEDGASFSFPKEDVAMLPIVHSTAEELAIYLWGRILGELDAQFLRQRGVHTMEVTCAEAIGQEALFRMEIPDDKDGNSITGCSDVRSYVNKRETVPSPCLDQGSESNQITPDCNVISNNKRNLECKMECCNCSKDFSKKMQALVDALNTGNLRHEKEISLTDVSNVFKSMES